MRRDAGVTLLELMVAIAILGVAASVAGLALSLDSEPDPAAARAEKIVAARREALESGRAVGFVVSMEDGRVVELRALPDGRVLGDTAAAVDALTGRPHAAR